jgi:hypothetical protein
MSLINWLSPANDASAAFVPNLLSNCTDDGKALSPTLCPNPGLNGGLEFLQEISIWQG